MTSKWLLVLAVASAVLSAANGLKNEEIKLPKDAEIVTVVSENFRITIENLNQRWRSVQEEALQVESPRGTDQDKDLVIVNTDLYEKNKGVELSSEEEGESPKSGSDSETDTETSSESGSKPRKPRILSADLYDWIVDRASHLSEQSEKYLYDLKLAKNNDDKVILQLLFLNTLVDLQNIAKEKKLKKILWVRSKTTNLLQYKALFEASIHQWIQTKVQQNEAIEKANKGSSNLKDTWFSNLQALRRVLHEQRFSEAIGRHLVDFLGGKYSMMTRGHLFDVSYKPNNEGLVYSESRRRIPPFFSFSAQYALVNGPRRLLIDKLVWFKTY